MGSGEGMKRRGVFLWEDYIIRDEIVRYL